MIRITYGQVLKASENPITFRPLNTSNGLIFGSVTFLNEKPNYNSYFLKIDYISDDKKLVRKNSKEVRLTPKQIFKVEHDGELDKGLTYLFTTELAEGNYEITGFRLFTNGPSVVLQKTGYTNRFSIPFKVEKGIIKYTGNIFFNDNTKNNNSEVLTYKNNFQKDFESMKKVQPYVYWNNAVNAVLNQPNDIIKE